MARNKVRLLSQCSGLERGGLNKLLNTVGFCSLTYVCNVRRNIQNGGNRKWLKLYSAQARVFHLSAITFSNVSISITNACSSGKALVVSNAKKLGN